MGGGSINILGLGALLPLIGRFGWRGILLLVAIFLIVNYTGLCSGGSLCSGGGGHSPDRGAVTPTERGKTGQDELSRFAGYVLDDVRVYLSQCREHLVPHAIASEVRAQISLIDADWEFADVAVGLDLLSGYAQERSDKEGTQGRG